MTTTDKYYIELEVENKELKDQVDYDGVKIEILEKEINDAMDYLDEAIERYSSPMIHKTAHSMQSNTPVLICAPLLTDFKRIKEILMN
tara:strand:- start:8 stop:271 length:264 start_codon:yes stop_codon:yes gene_type:complete